MSVEEEILLSRMEKCPQISTMCPSEVAVNYWHFVTPDRTSHFTTCNSKVLPVGAHHHPSIVSLTSCNHFSLQHTPLDQCYHHCHLSQWGRKWKSECLVLCVFSEDLVHILNKSPFAFYALTAYPYHIFQSQSTFELPVWWQALVSHVVNKWLLVWWQYSQLIFDWNGNTGSILWTEPVTGKEVNTDLPEEAVWG